jgi:hypothetical protein
MDANAMSEADRVVQAICVLFPVLVTPRFTYLVASPSIQV